MRRNIFATGLLLGLMLVSTTQAAIILELEPNKQYSTPGGVQALDLFARATAGELLIGLTADIQIGGAVFAPVPGRTGLDPLATNFIGFGNLNPASSFTRDTSNPRIAALSLDFNAPQLFPAANQILVTLNFDTIGLSPGFYPINFLDITASTSANSFPGQAPSGGFSVVPEPTSILLLSVAGLAGVSRRRFRRTAVVS